MEEMAMKLTDIVNEEIENSEDEETKEVLLNLAKIEVITSAVSRLAKKLANNEYEGDDEKLAKVSLSILMILMLEKTKIDIEDVFDDPDVEELVASMSNERAMEFIKTI